MGQSWDKYRNSIALVWDIRKTKRIERLGRFLLRSLFNPLASDRWISAALELPEIRPFTQSDARLLLKPGRHYLSRRLKINQRVDSLIAHYKAVSQVFSKSTVHALSQGGEIDLAAFVGKSGAEYRVTLSKTNKFDREGELILALRNQGGREVFFVVISLAHLQDELTFVIGCLQGPSGHDSRPLIKAATQDSHGIRPKNLLLDVVNFMAIGLGASRIYGVSNACRIFQGDRTFADYDLFWKELAGQETDAGLFEIPTKIRHHNLAEISSHHRAEYKRRIQLRETVFLHLAESLRKFSGHSTGSWSEDALARCYRTGVSPELSR